LNDTTHGFSSSTRPQVPAFPPPIKLGDLLKTSRAILFRSAMGSIAKIPVWLDCDPGKQSFTTRNDERISDSISYEQDMM
jgi:hypothetical protein